MSERIGRKARIRARLIDAALDLFERQGFEETTVAQITAVAGVTERTFYNHFPTKADVLFPAELGSRRGVKELILDRPSDESDFEVLCTAGIRWLADFPAELGGTPMQRRLGRLRLRNSDDSPVVLGKRLESQAGLVSGLVDGVAERNGRRTPALEDTVLGVAIAAVLRQAFFEWVQTDTSSGFESVAVEYVAALSRSLGLATTSSENHPTESR